MASASLSRTQGTATNRNIFTVSMWVKQSKLGSQTSAHQYMDFYVSADIRISIYQMASDQIAIYMKGGGYADNIFYTTAVYRDTSAWYHFVWRFDTTQSTAADRVRMYVNGEQVTDFVSSNYPAQNFNLQQGTSSYTQYIGRYGGHTNNNFDGQMAHVHFTDGYSYAASTFGQTDATTGIWKPITSPSVTYGNNGFFLKFDNSGNMGLDSSGQGNNLTTSGTIIQAKDTPSNVFATFNPLAKHPSCGISFADGNNKITTTTSRGSVPSTLGFNKGKYYFEFDTVTTPQDGRWEIGIQPFANVEANDATNSNNKMIGLNGYNGYIYYNGSSINNFYNTVGGFTGFTGIIGVAVDLTSSTKTMAMSRDGAWITGQAATSTDFANALKVDITSSVANYDYWHFGVGTGNGSGTAGVGQANFGNGYFGTTAVTSAQNPDDGVGIFEYSVPSGYKALCTKSINAQEYS